MVYQNQTGPVDAVGKAGRKMATKDPKAFLIAVMNDAGEESKTRIDAAKALLPYVCQKVGEVGKKEERQEAAKKVASRFSTAAPPKLVAAGGRKV